MTFSEILAQSGATYHLVCKSGATYNNNEVSLPQQQVLKPVVGLHSKFMFLQTAVQRGQKVKFRIVQQSSEQNVIFCSDDFVL